MYVLHQTLLSPMNFAKFCFAFKWFLKLFKLRALDLVIPYGLIRLGIVKNKLEPQARSGLFTSLKNASLIK